MLAVRVRSGLEETYHDGAVAISEPNGTLVGSAGDIDRPFYLRSSAKPFQGFVSQSSGALLNPVQLAVACSSHRGHPVQIAVVESILASVGLDEGALQCPPGWPINDEARDRLLTRGASRPRRIWHNCSGKHAAFLASCAATGWPIETYLEPNHPIQRRVVDLVTELSEYPVEPVGVDGCGAPVMRTTTRAMSLLFARLGNQPRFDEVFTAMHRYPALIAGNGEGDSAIGTATHGVAKGGALGCVGVALKGGVGIAAKSWDGLNAMADVGAIEALRWLGGMVPAMAAALEPIGRPLQYGGGREVGYVESRLDMRSP